MQLTALFRNFMAARILAFAALGMLALTTQAQESGADSIPEDYYRAEILLFERIVDPAAVEEQMADREVQPPIQTEEALWIENIDGSTQSTLDLAPNQELHLRSAAQRLQNSGRYRVLVSAGWYQAFPPDYEGEPLRIEVGDLIDGTEQREIEGHITIDRQRYLHVGVHLNHWQARQSIKPSADTGEDDTSPQTGFSLTPPEPMVDLSPTELVTWIRETRRMRSEEVHLLDSPTIGVLVFFKKVEAES